MAIPTMIAPENVTIIYVGDNKKHQSQPLLDVEISGVLEDPYGQTDYRIEAVRINKELFPPDNVVIVYCDDEGYFEEQPLLDLQTVGTLEDPDGEQDYRIIGVRTNGVRVR